MKKAIAILLPVLAVSIVFAQSSGEVSTGSTTETGTVIAVIATTGDVNTGDVNTGVVTTTTGTELVSTGVVSTGNVWSGKCYKEAWGLIVKEYKGKRAQWYKEKVELRKQVYALTKERSKTKDKAVRTELTAKIKALNTNVYKLTKESAASYKAEYKAKIAAKKAEAKSCRVKK